MPLCARLTIICAILAASAGARGAELAEAPECYDAIVSGWIAKQTPTRIPDCSDCIVMAWPWVLELDVDKVIMGPIRPGKMTVLSVQHTYFVSSPYPRELRLRRNDQRGFNLIRASGAEMKRCPARTPPARAFLRPAGPERLRELVRKGEEEYGPGPE